MMEKITPEQQKQLDKLGKKFILKQFFNGAHHALMAVVMNLILFMGVQAYLDGNTTVGLLGSVLVGLFVARRLLRTFQGDAIELSENAKKIIQD